MARRGPGMALRSIAPLVQGMTPMEAGIALFLLLWTESGQTVPVDDLEACCAIAKAVTAPNRASVVKVVETLFQPLSSVTHVTQPASQRYAAGNSRYAGSETVVTQEEIPVVTQTTNGHEYRNPPVSNLDRQRATRTKRIALCELLTSEGVPVNSRMGLLELEKLCVHSCIPIPEILDPNILRNDTTRSLARAVSINTDGIKNTEFSNSSLRSVLVSGSRARPLPEVSTHQHAEAMTAAGLPDVNAHHPELVALVAAGCSVDDLPLAAVEADARGKGFSYAVGIARNRRWDAARVPTPQAPPPIAPEPPRQLARPSELPEVQARIQALRTPLHARRGTPSQSPEDCSSLDESTT